VVSGAGHCCRCLDLLEWEPSIRGHGLPAKSLLGWMPIQALAAVAAPCWICLGRNFF